MSYGDIEAVRGIDLDVRRGEILALLGPNGAGKTTTVEILEGFHQRDRRRGAVLGDDPGAAARACATASASCCRSPQPELNLTVRECLELYAGYYSAPRDVDETIALAGLGEQAEQRRASSPAASAGASTSRSRSIGDPELIFLDEPTTGFDPGRAARARGRSSPACARSARRSSSPRTTWRRPSGSPTASWSWRGGEIVARARRRRSAAATAPRATIAFRCPTARPTSCAPRRRSTSDGRVRAAQRGRRTPTCTR